MKKILLLTAAIALLAMPAMAGIKDSRHNLGMTGNFEYRATNGVTQICVFCHTPHNPVQNVPLWNRNAPSQSGYAFYSSVTLASANVKAGALAADSISLFCLSCHDGASGMWALVKNGGVESGATPGGSLTMGGFRAIMKDANKMRNDHPVNVQISVAAADVNDVPGNWHSVAEIKSGGVRLFASTGTGSQTTGSDYVECASCHDPHKTDYSRFLRKSNLSSNLCLTCHNK